MNLKQQTSLVGVLIWLAASGALAQTNVTSTSQPTREGQTVSPDKLTVTDVSTTSNLRPTRTERQKLPPEVLDRLEKFKQSARDYLNQQEDLKKQLQGANDKERAAIREKVKQLREHWLEQAREMRKEFRQRQLELIDKLPDYREVIQSARNAAKESAAQTQADTRPHRGED